MDQFSNPRELRGLKILSEPDTIIKTGKNEWDVRSQSKDAYYQVTRKFITKAKADHYTWSCTCPDFATRNQPCKHIYAVQFSLKLKVDVEADIKAQKIIGDEIGILCPICKSQNVVRRGIRQTFIRLNKAKNIHLKADWFLKNEGVA
jgi:hypothetical protein